jgi:vesicular inhibitory amino acid transporter
MSGDAAAHKRRRRRSSVVSRRSLAVGMELGRSTNGQTVSWARFRERRRRLTGSWAGRQQLFNAIAVLVGIGVLSEPLAFAYCGWIGGTLLLLFFGLFTNYTWVCLVRATRVLHLVA